jgi:hypothetical protein
MIISFLSLDYIVLVSSTLILTSRWDLTSIKAGEGNSTGCYFTMAARGDLPGVKVGVCVRVIVVYVTAKEIRELDVLLKMV